MREVFSIKENPMKKFASLAALVMLPVLSIMFSVTAAAAPGQLAGGSNLYKVRNVTQNGTYSSSISAVCSDTVKYSVEVSNSQYGALTDVTVKADLASGAINVSAKNDASATVTSNGNVTVSTNGGTLQYVAGSTQLYSINGQLIKTLSDGVATGGVNAGDLGGSTREFVQFQAKVNCVEQPKNIQVCELATKTIITIREDQFDAAKHSKNLADCAVKPPVPGEITVCRMEDKTIVNIKENEFNSAKYTKDLSKCATTPVTPTELPHTGATGGAIAIVASLLTAAAGYVVTARKNVLG
jgi:LPXTG-motif cell wall-anchored protein